MRAKKLDYGDVFFQNKAADAPFKVRNDLAPTISRCLECGCTVGEHGAAHAPPAALQLLTLDALPKTFGAPKYAPGVDPMPLAGKNIERDHVVPAFRAYVDVLLQRGAKKPKAASDQNRENYPLCAVLGCSGAGKTHVLRLIGHHWVCNEGAVVAHISFRSSSPLSQVEVPRGAQAAIAAHIFLAQQPSDRRVMVRLLTYCDILALAPTVARPLRWSVALRGTCPVCPPP